mmetsp:Transcript_7235/g.5221  ORF Transcript_7235/g.5221 Transcript_7235/m.5221 type:complete len:141 (-) Transcript_7235:399-821(-)
MDEQEPVKLIVMGNSKFAQNKFINGVFDLKGSLVNRYVPGGPHKPTATLKDLNLLEMSKERNWIRFRKEDQISIMKTLEKDVQMLKILNLMDYSLLLCVESNPDYVKALNDGIISARTIHSGSVDDTASWGNERSMSTLT